MNENGYFLVHRGLREHALFKTKKPFSSFEVWIDLIELANSQDSEFCHKSELHIIPRGSFVTTYRALAKKWNWSPNRVIRELSVFQKIKIISVKTLHSFLQITLCNYDEFQLLQKPNETAARHPRDTRETLFSANLSTNEPLFSIFAHKEELQEVRREVRKEVSKKGRKEGSKEVRKESKEEKKESKAVCAPLAIIGEKLAIIGDIDENGKKRACRLPVKTLPPEWKDFCITRRADLDPEETFKRFSDYWLAVPGAKARKLDWTATWRNWVRGERLALKSRIPQEKPLKKNVLTINSTGVTDGTSEVS